MSIIGTDSYLDIPGCLNQSDQIDNGEYHVSDIEGFNDPLGFFHKTLTSLNLLVSPFFLIYQNDDDEL